MKSIIALSTITILATLALAGCNQNTSTGSADMSGTNSGMSGAISGNTNMPATNNMPNMNTNMPASTNQ